jgi:uncharacterized membrane protein
MEKLVAVVVPDRKDALACLQILEELDADGDVTLFATDIVHRDERAGADGTLSVEHQSDRGPVGMGAGMLVGSVLGAFGGPVGVGVGFAIGGLIGALAQYVHYARVGATFTEQIRKELPPGTFAVLADMEEAYSSRLDERVAPLASRVIRELPKTLAKQRRNRRFKRVRAPGA